MDLPLDFKELLEAFGAAAVEHVLIGGYAVAFHGHPRATKDIDILVEGSPENLTRAATALAAFGAPPNVIEAIRSMTEDQIVYFGQPPMRVDVLRTRTRRTSKMAHRARVGDGRQIGSRSWLPVKNPG